MGAGRTCGAAQGWHRGARGDRLNPIKTDGGMLIIASVVDITQRKRAEETLRRRQTCWNRPTMRFSYGNWWADRVLEPRASSSTATRADRRSIASRRPAAEQLAARNRDFREALLRTGQWTANCVTAGLTAGGSSWRAGCRGALRVRAGLCLETTGYHGSQAAERQLKKLNRNLERRVAERTASCGAAAELVGRSSGAPSPGAGPARSTAADARCREIQSGLSAEPGVEDSQRQALREVNDVLDESWNVPILTFEMSPPILTRQHEPGPALARPVDAEQAWLAVYVEADEKASLRARKFGSCCFTRCANCC